MRVLLLLLVLPLAGCLNDAGTTTDSDPEDTDWDAAPSLAYTPVEPDMALQLRMDSYMVPGSSGNELYVRVVRPTGDGPFPVIVQHTPYTAPGCNAGLDVAGVGVEPPAGGCNEGTFDREFVRRGYAFAYADLRGTGDSNDCLNLRGAADIADIGKMADALADMPWSNGNVGFIGASYPGSTSHMAALSGSPAVKAVVPIVASTSFYHYHHNSGVPYNGNHALGGTNTGYTSQGLTPTFNPISGVGKLSNQPLCPHVENAVMHGGLDQTGDYYAWWQERNLRPLASTVTIPVLMAQGLADWNVKPDHIANWFNDIQSESKTFIGGQWGHAYPATDDGACGGASDTTLCQTPWGNWWAYAAAFFDTYLKEIDTGMFHGSTAWVQDNSRTWHRSNDFPIQAADRDSMKFYLLEQDFVRDASLGGIAAGWYACPHDMVNRGTALGAAEAAAVECDDEPIQELVFETPAFPRDVIISGVPLVNLTINTQGRTTHLTVVMEHLDADGNVKVARENYGYLNPLYRNGLDKPEAMPRDYVQVSIDLYPQEDMVLAGEKLRFTIGSNDGGRSIEFYDEGFVNLELNPGGMGEVWLPLRPAELQGVRLG